MPKLRIKNRPNSISRDYGYRRAETPYPEFVFNNDEGGGTTFALGLDVTGRVRALVYLPPPSVDMKQAREIAIERLVDYALTATPTQVRRLREKRQKTGKLVEMPKVVEVKFTPFQMEGI